MAQKMARMFGTEEDKVNCPFYHKMGACRHGDQCSRTHNKPLMSPTILLPHLFVNPMASVLTNGGRLTRDQEKEIQERFLDFYEDVFLEVTNYGEVEEMVVCDNLVDHLIGNVYIRFATEEEAAEALSVLNGRWYAARQITAEFSPVTEFREARCRQFDDNGCSRGGYCNFMHLKKVPREFSEELFATQPHQSGGSRDKGRDREPERGAERDRGGDRGGRGDGFRRDDRGGDRYPPRRDHDDRGGGGGGGYRGYDRDRDRGYDRDRDRDRGYDRDRDRDGRGGGGGGGYDRYRDRDYDARRGAGSTAAPPPPPPY